jgi:hypothetical protein
MKKRYDFLHTAILILFLVIAYFIGNAILRGILLLVFSGVLMFNTIVKLKTVKSDKIRDKILYGILLFLDSVLLLGAIYVIVSAMIAVF